jgi:uncharacterized phage protein gp47/JayE
MTTPMYSFYSKTPKQFHDDVVRTIKNALIAQGIATPNVGPNSDFDIIATAISIELALINANQVILADQLMPDTAAASFLDRWLSLVGLARRPAIPSSGLITPTYSLVTGYTTVPPAAQLVDSVGNIFVVASPGNYGPGNPPSQPANLYVPVVAAAGGASTDHLAGDTLRWVTAPAYMGPNATVGIPGSTAGLSGGEDSEVGVDEPPRSRLFQLLQNPPKGGNSADIAGWASASTPIVAGCAVYPALQGPGSVFFTVWQSPQLVGPFGSGAKSRVILSALVQGAILPYIAGLVPEHVFSVGSPTVDQPTDVALLLSLPSAPTGSPPGPGNGWLDGSPWPQSVGGTAPVIVTAVAATNQFTVNATTPPVPGVSRIAYISPSNWQLYTATVVSYTGTSGAYVITTDTPWPPIANGNHIFPQSAQQANYFAAALQGFANLGPGEWTTSLGVLARAFRHPPPSISFPYSLDPNFLRTVINAGPEVENANFLYRSSTTPTPGVYPPVVNSVGVLTSTPPAVLTPRNMSWYQQ